MQRHTCVAHTPEEALYAIGKCRKNVEHGHGAQIAAAIMHQSISITSACENAHERLAEDKEHTANCNAVDAFKNHTFQKTVPHTILASSAAILGNKGGHRDAKTALRQKSKIVHALRRVKSGNRFNTQRIDSALNQKFGYRLHRLLQSRD